MKRFRVSLQATTDLREIYDYVASDNRDAADRLIEQFFDHFQRLAEHPELGERRDDLYPGVRQCSTVAISSCTSRRPVAWTLRMLHTVLEISSRYWRADDHEHDYACRVAGKAGLVTAPQRDCSRGRASSSVNAQVVRKQVAV